MKGLGYCGVCIVSISILVGCAATSDVRPSAPAETSSVPLRLNLGDYTYPISTSVPLAQRYFDQGLILAFGFNHAEASRSFQEAQRLDPMCAMCSWGEALVLGPNINAPMADTDVPRAYELAQKAQALAGNVTDSEHALIEALTQRYANNARKDRSSLDQDYAEAMRELRKVFPEDATIGSLFAESLMDLHPWNFWTKQGEAQPWTPEILVTLETVLTHAPNHPLANHLYIHAVEASPDPGKALPSAERLATLVPGSGHLVHMPSHIYLRVGRYADAAKANRHAVMVDHHYLSHQHAEGLYTLAYVPHNYHFLWAAAIKTGQQNLAMQAAIDGAMKVDASMLRHPELAGTMQHFLIMPLYTQALFGEWEVIMHNARPPEDLLYPVAIWHYARGLALVRLDDAGAARHELEALRTILKDPGIVDLTIFGLNPVSKILMIAERVLAGELAAHEGLLDEAVAHVSQAVALEDSLNYTEPEDWYLPSRQVLGAMLLEHGDAARAEQTFREDLSKHPQNGWSLYGLMASLQVQEKTSAAMKVQKQYEQVWADADVALSNSRF